MSTLFAFLHHVAAFTLVAALAIEFMLIRQNLTVDNARRLAITDAVLGASAGILLVVGLLRVFYFEKGYVYYFSNHAFGGTVACRHRAKARDHPQDHPLGARGDCAHPSVRGDDGAGYFAIAENESAHPMDARFHRPTATLPRPFPSAS
jgi:hypothetical protein